MGCLQRCMSLQLAHRDKLAGLAEVSYRGQSRLDLLATSITVGDSRRTSTGLRSRPSRTLLASGTMRRPDRGTA
jgi:hypothetical protein